MLLSSRTPQASQVLVPHVQERAHNGHANGHVNGHANGHAVVNPLGNTAAPFVATGAPQDHFLTAKLQAREDRKMTEGLIAEARRHHRSKQGKQAFSRTLVELEMATDSEIAAWIGEFNKFRVVGAGQLLAAPDANKVLSEPIARTRFALPIKADRKARKVTVAISDPETPQFTQVRHALLAWDVEWVVAPHADVEAIVKETYTPRVEASTENELERFVEQMLKEAANTRGLSDIHVIPEERNTRILFRIDGKMIPHRTVPQERRMQLAAQMKLATGRGVDGRPLSGVNVGVLDVATQLIPQDASTVREWGAKRVSLRFSTLPTINGESIVVRILDQNAQIASLRDLGFLTDHHMAYRAAVMQPNGMVIAVGGTGQGKSTTLAAGIKIISADPDRTIFSVEDPVEYRLRGVRQVQVRSEAGLTFATTLRAVLRQDPDVILVGEMRDEETAEIGTRASMTGHLVATTAHANTASLGINRLIDLGVSPGLVASSVQLLFAQRLVARVCKGCRQVRGDSPDLIKKHSHDLSSARKAGVFSEATEAREPIFYEAGGGCEQCNGRGFIGRVVIVEQRPMNDHVQSLLQDRGSQFSAREAESFFAKAYADGQFTARNMRQDGIIKAALGWTTLEEVFAETSNIDSVKI